MNNGNLPDAWLFSLSSATAKAVAEAMASQQQASSRRRTRTRALTFDDNSGGGKRLRLSISIDAQMPPESPLQQQEQGGQRDVAEVKPEIKKEVVLGDADAAKDECPICLESLQLPVRLQCAHIYCYLCAKGLTVRGVPKCALCRAPIDPRFISQLSLQDVVETDEKNDKGEVACNAKGPKDDSDDNDNDEDEEEDSDEGDDEEDEEGSDEGEDEQGNDEEDDSSGEEHDECGNMAWFYSGRSSCSWWRFSEGHSQILESQFKQNPEGSVNLFICGFHYVIDFKNMLQYRQDCPEITRAIKRDKAEAKCKGVAGLRAYGVENSGNTSD